MLVFKNAKLAFFAVPRTGSSAVQKAFGPVSDVAYYKRSNFKHMRPTRFYASGCRGVARGDAANYAGIVVLRDPLDRLASYYRYRQRDRILGKAQSTKGLSFEAFLVEYMKRDPAPYAALGRQTAYTLTSNGEILPRHIFAYEHLHKLVAFINSKLGTSCVLSRINTSPMADITVTDATRAALRSHLASDYQLYEEARTGALANSHR